MADRLSGEGLRTLIVPMPEGLAADRRHRSRQCHHVSQELQPAAGAEVAPGINLNIDAIGVRASPTAQPTSVLRSCTAWPVSGSMCATRAMPARMAVANTAPVGICRLQSSPSRAGAGQDLVSTGLIPRAGAA